MRFRLKKSVTWILIIVCFVWLTFNFYNKSVWIQRDISRPWGRNFDSPLYHTNMHFPHVTLGYTNETPHNRTLFHSNSRGQLYNTKTASLDVLWPDNVFYDDDRITNQLKFKPEWLAEKLKKGENIPLKKILVYNGLSGWNVQPGQRTFKEQMCPINTCELTDSHSAKDADAVLFAHSPQIPWTVRPAHQVWILFLLESPYHTPGLNEYKNVFNWTATYRHDSDIVAPYEKFVRLNEFIMFLNHSKSYAAGKTKKVAWFVSNCAARNRRREYAEELSKYIDVDIYGSCGKLQCPRSDNKCFDMLNTDYKFYLSFENSNCRDYITEKFFVTGLQHDVIPVVMGGAPEDYQRASPPHSFIHVDNFESPEKLAEYLHKLDKNDDLYNEYFRWKGTGTFINTFFWCRICAMLHETQRGTHVYRDLEKWWRGDGVCIGKENWRQRKRKSKYIVEDYLL